MVVASSITWSVTKEWNSYYYNDPKLGKIKVPTMDSKVSFNNDGTYSVTTKSDPQPWAWVVNVPTPWFEQEPDSSWPVESWWPVADRWLYGNKPSRSTTPTSAPAATSTKPAAPTQTTPTSWGSGGGFSFSPIQIEKMMEKYGGNREALYKDIFKIAREKWMDWAKVLRQLNTSLSTQRKQSSDKQKEEEKEAAWNILPDSWVQSINDTMSWLEKNRQDYLEEQDKIKAEMVAINEDSRLAATQWYEERKKILENRVVEADTMFSQIQEQIKELETFANAQFDQSVAQAMKARANQMAAKWLLTSAQAWAASSLMLSDYRANAELKRSEIMIKVKEQMINTIQEKQKIIDTIMQDQWLLEADKANAVERINWVYNNILWQYANQWLSTNQAIDNSIINVYGQKISIDVAEKVKEVEMEFQNKLDAQTQQKVTNDPNARLDYLMQKINEIDPAMSKYAANYLQEYIKNGTFMTTPTMELLAGLASKAAAWLWKDLWSKSLYGVGWWMAVWAQQYTPTPNQNQTSVPTTAEQQPTPEQQQATDQAAQNIVMQDALQNAQATNTPIMSSAEWALDLWISPKTYDEANLLERLASWFNTPAPWLVPWSAMGTYILR